jgi:hypothetical protein
MGLWLLLVLLFILILLDSDVHVIQKKVLELSHGFSPTAVNPQHPLPVP